MVYAQELEDQRPRLGFEVEVSSRGVQQNARINHPRAVDANNGVEGSIPTKRQQIDPRGRA